MASFPTDWEVHPAENFASYAVDELVDSPLGVNMLMLLDQDNRSAGSYKLSLFGGGIIEASYPLGNIIPDLPPQFEQLYVHSHFKAHRIVTVANACSTAWRDLDILLQERTLSLYNDADTEPEDPAPLIKYLQDQKAAKTGVGASLRFGIAAGPDKKIRLEVQSLPAPSKSLNAKANLRTDNAVSVLLGYFPVNADLFAGNNPGGPVPLFFAPDPARALAAMNANPDAYRYDIGLINSQILHCEHLSLDEAQTYLQARARAAKGTPAFPLSTAPPAKKPRLHASTAAATGDKLT